jgi:hypothetical protein
VQQMHAHVKGLKLSGGSKTLLLSTATRTGEKASGTSNDVLLQLTESELDQPSTTQ